ncbi:hypothetical protein [Haloarchaeobius sp. HME9146]|uniref:hypothetical protein n=1 Tax=Haloarchaeobius sp. HME9146 TaxID=2978732 RepID=UPI0021C0AD0A|nr:hypothetical protein [Haloarchaeobius sp. HME9146]MCT9094422.1 hypothetical protein [Haloarchaeobius sp. HME9146]
MVLSHQATALLVRLLHLLAVTVLVGGAVVVWLAFRRDSRDTDDADRTAEHLLPTAASYEWLFWGALGVVVMTGVGNLGALAPAVPTTETRWGAVLALKLAVLLGFVLFSMARSLAVVRVRRLGLPGSEATLTRAYGLTAGVLVLLLSLAEVLAHG